MRSSSTQWVVLLCTALWPWASLAADTPRTMRDPMQAPAATRAPEIADAAPAAPPTPRQLIVVDGRRYVVEGTRRRGVGDLLGGARIERIDDAAVVVRQGQTTQRLPLFGKVVKQAVADPDAAAAAAAGTAGAALASPQTRTQNPQRPGDTP